MVTEMDPMAMYNFEQHIGQLKMEHILNSLTKLALDNCFVRRDPVIMVNSKSKQMAQRIQGLKWWNMLATALQPPVLMLEH